MLCRPNLILGQQNYTINCAACHGDKGFGDGIVASSLRVNPDNIYQEITNPFGMKYERINSVLEGDNSQQGVMPAFNGILTKKEVNDIFGYIESINKA